MIIFQAWYDVIKKLDIKLYIQYDLHFIKNTYTYICMENFFFILLCTFHIFYNEHQLIL